MWQTVARSALMIVVVLSLGSPGAHAQDVPRNTKPFTPFKVLLSSPFFNGSLPFDVAFILWGDVPPNTAAGVPQPTAAYLRIAELSGGAPDCSSISPNAYGPVQRSEARAWTAVDYADRGISAPPDVATSTTRQFEFRINPLKPQRSYCFLFQKEPGRLISAPESALLVPALLPAYQTFLQGTGAVGMVDEVRAEQLRQALVHALLAAVPGSLEGFSPVAGSVYDPAAAPAGVFSEFLEMARQVFQPHDNAISFLTGANQPVRPGAITTFSEWSASPSLTTLAGTLPANSQVRAQIAAVQSWTPEQRTRFLLQGTASQAIVPVADSWTAVPTFTTKPDFDHTAEDPCPDTGPLSPRCRALDDARVLLVAIQNAATAAGSTVLADQVGRTVSEIGDLRKVNLLNLQSAVNLRDSAMRAHLAKLEGYVRTSILVMTTTLGNLETRRAWYAGLDTGFAIAPRLNEVFPYVGTDLYFRPINREAPPTSFLTRFSALFGVTWTSNLVKPGETGALYGDNAMLLIGVGLRATEFIRLGGGALVLKGIDPNPLINDTRIELTPYFALSIDIDVAGVFGRFFGAGAKLPVIGGGAAPQ